MIQESRTLSGKPLQVPEQPKVHTEADEIRIGRQLFQEIGGFIDRDEQVPEELALAFEAWKENAATLAHSPRASTRRAFGAMWTALDRGIFAKVGDAHARSMAAQYGPPGAPDEFGRGAEQALAMPPIEWPPIEPELEGRAFEIDAATRRASSIMRNPIEMTPEGQAIVTDSEGEVWDLTEALAEWNRPEVKEALRQSMMGQVPDPSNPALSSTVGSMGLVQLGAELGGKLVGKDVRRIETANAGITLPWIVGLGPNATPRGDEQELLKDPLWTRALEETLATIDPTAGGWETFGHALAGGADFALFAGALGLAAKGVGAAAAATLPAGPASVVRSAAKALTFKPGKVWPMNSDTLRTMLGFGAYESVTKATDDSTTLPEDFWNGLQQGALFAFAGKAAKLGRGVVQGALAKTPLGTALSRMAPRMGEVGKSGDSDVVLDQIRRFAEPTFSGTVGKLNLAAPAREAVQHAIDAHWMGVLVHSWAMAQEAPPGERFSEFWHGLVDKKSHATGFAFALSGALQYPLGVRPQVLAAMKTPEGQEGMKRMARAYASPSAETHLREIDATLKEWAKREPDIFEGIKLVPPAEAEAKVKAAVEAMREAERPPDALPALKEMRKDQGNEKPANVGEFPTAALQMLLGTKAKSDSGIRKHAINAVHEYLRVVEKNTETKFKRLSEIPEALFRRVLDWRDKGKLPPEQLTLKAEAEALSAIPWPRKTVPGPLFESRKIEGETFEQQVARLKAERAAWIAEVEKAVGEQGAAEIDVGDGRTAIVSREPMNPDRWRVTHIDASGQPTGHMEAATLQEAAKLARGKGAKVKPARGSIEEAAEVLKDVEAEPAYEGLAPVEKVAHAKAKKAARRPSLGNAIASVAVGKKTAEWLRTTFPEGAKEVGEGPVDSWAGKFERAVRATWKDQSALRARNQLSKIAGRRATTLRNWVARVGGVKFMEDLAGLAEEDAGKGRPVVHKKGSERGLEIDVLTTMAHEEGFFAERPTVNELMDALHENMIHPGKAAEAAMYAHERDVERTHGEQLNAYRDALERGEAPMLDRQRLADTFAGDPRYEGMTPERIEKEVLQLRAQAAAGDPGAMLAAPPESPTSLAQRAVAGLERIHGELRALGVFDPGADPQRGRLDAIDQLFHVERSPDVPVETWDRLRAEAVAVKETARDALRRAMAGSWEEGQLRQLEDVWAVVDARTEGRDAPAGSLERLKAEGWLEESGAIKTAYLDRMQQEASTYVQGLADIAETGFASGVVPLAFVRRKFTDVVDNKWGRLASWGFWLDRPAVQRVLGKPWPRKVFKAFTTAFGTPLTPVFNLGPISRPQSTRFKRIMEQSLLRMGVRRGDSEQARIAASYIGSQLARHYGGLRAPQADHDFFARGMDSGLFAKAKGPADLEALRPGSGYMWPIYTGLRDLVQEIGEQRVRLGTMSQEQLDALGGGRYLTHFYITDQLEHEAAALGRGELLVKYRGRSMSRDGVPNPADPIMRVPDAEYAIRRGVFEETQEIRVFGTLRDFMDRYGEWTFSADQLHDFGAFDRADMQRAGVRTVPFEGESLIDAVARRARDRREAPETLLLGARLQVAHEQMAPPGEKPGKGQVPYTKELDTLLKYWLGEGPEGPIYIPRPLAQELEITMSEVFSIPGENPAAKFAAVVDTAMMFKKRGLTALRPANWALNFTSNALRNSALGGVPLNDFIRGIAGAPSFTRDGISGLGHVMRWVKEGAPKDRPAGWTDAEWVELKDAQNFMKIAGTSTSMVQTLGQEFVSEFGQAVVSPDVTRGAWMKKLDEQAAANGWALNQRDRMALNIEEKIGRMFSGLERLDTRILGWLNESDPSGKAKALASYTTAWNLTDLFFFKYPAYLKARHEWPDLPQSRVLAYALDKTGNMADTAPWLRTHLSKHGPWNDKLWRASRGTIQLGKKKTGEPLIEVERARMQMWASQLLRHRFWMDATTMTPAILRGAVTHPFRMGINTAIGFGAAAWAMSFMDEDERKKWEEEAAVARRAVTRWPALSEKEEESFRRFGHSIGRPGNLDVRLPKWGQDAMASWWKQLHLKDPFVIPMPKHGGESRQGSLSQLFPAGQVLDQARGYARLARGIGGAGDSQEARQDMLMGIEQLFGMNAQLGASLFFGAAHGESAILDALGGKGSVSAALAQALVSVAGTAGVMYPTLGLFTPEGQFLGEAVATGGQRWNEALRGIGRAYNPQDPASNLAGVGLRYAWPSRSIYQRNPLQSPVDGWTAILSEMYGDGFQPSSAEGRAKLRAHRWVSSQMSTMIGDLYEQHFDQAGDPRYVDWTLDERIRGAFDEMFAHTQVDQFGRGRIEPGYQPQGFLLQQIAAQPEQAEIIPHLRAWATRDRFQEDGMSMLLEAGRKTEMPKALFREAFRNALEDPAGGNLVKWWWSQAEHADEETLGHLAPLMWDVQVPAENSEAFKSYLKLMDRYRAANFSWPPIAEGAKRAKDVLGELGHSEALQGGEAFRTFILNRPERPSELELLFMPK